MLSILFSKRVQGLIIMVGVLTCIITIVYIAGKNLNTGETYSLPTFQVPVEQYLLDDWKQRKDSLKTLYGKNKQLIPAYELQILLALSHYPELKEIPIHFYEEEALIPLASRPEPITMLYAKEKWQYNVIISTKSIESLEPVLVKNLPFEAQIGIVGHELAHTAYYLDKNRWQMLAIGLNYIFPSFRAGFEKNTDRRTIAHGLGWQLLSYARYARKVMAYEETSLGSEYYLSPKEIEVQMQQTY